MNANALDNDKLLRQVLTSIAQLPPNDLLVVYETIGDLKKQRAHPNREAAAEILARAKARAEEIKHLSREEAMERFGKTLDAIRTDAIANGTAIEGELEGD
jgi:hypothetical protein